MAATAVYAPAHAVAFKQDPRSIQYAYRQAMRRFNADAALRQQLIAAMIPQVSQAVRMMTTEWPNKTLVKNLSGTELSPQAYDVVNRFGGLLPPPETRYGCIFFTFMLREGEKRIVKLGNRTLVNSSLFIENVQLTEVLGGV